MEEHNNQTISTVENQDLTPNTNKEEEFAPSNPSQKNGATTIRRNQVAPADEKTGAGFGIGGRLPPAAFIRNIPKYTRNTNESHDESNGSSNLSYLPLIIIALGILFGLVLAAVIIFIVLYK